jgi:hypothetical protein
MKAHLFSGKQRNNTALTGAVIGLALSSMLLAMTGTLWLFASRDLAATATYTERISSIHNRVGVGPRKLHVTPQEAASPVTLSGRCPGVNLMTIAATDVLNP